MPESELVSVGRVGRPHGLQGAFFVEDASDEPARFAVGAALVAGGAPARVVESKRAGGRVIVRLDRPVVRGAELAVPREQLPPPAEDSYYVFQLLGLVVEDESGRVLGRVADVVSAPANDVLELVSGLALPMVEDCVRKVDLAARRILVGREFGDRVDE